MWREVREVEGVAEEVERGWRRAECCFLQCFCNSFAVGVGMSRGVGWHGKQVWLHDVLFFATVLHHFLMSA